MLEEHPNSLQNKILVLGQESQYTGRLREEIEVHGFGTVQLSGFESALALIEDQTIAVVWVARKTDISDQKLQALRVRAFTAPILMVVDSADEAEVAEFLRVGADECVDRAASGTSVATLTVARIRQNERIGSLVIADGRYRLDANLQRLCRLDTHPNSWVELGKDEFHLMRLLGASFGKTVNTEHIDACIWGMPSVRHENDLRRRRLVQRLRERFRKLGGLRLDSVHARGYRLELVA